MLNSRQGIFVVSDSGRSGRCVVGLDPAVRTFVVRIGVSLLWLVLWLVLLLLLLLLELVLLLVLVLLLRFS